MKQKIKNIIFKYQYEIIMVIVGLIVAISDLTTKIITDGRSKTIIKGFVSVFSSHNTGAAWSIFSEHTWLLVIFSVIFIGIILFANYMFKGKNNLYAFAMGMLLAGAICNLYDRIAFGYVRDFISLDFMQFPIFNIADCGITVGVILLLLFFLIEYIKENKAKKHPIHSNNSAELLAQNIEHRTSGDAKINKPIKVASKDVKTKTKSSSSIAKSPSTKSTSKSLSSKKTPKTTSKSNKINIEKG